MLEPDLKMAQRFLDCLGPGEKFTFQTFDDKKNQLGHVAHGGCVARSLSRVFHGTLGQHATTLEELNAAGAGIFVMVNKGDGLRHEGKRTCRTNDNISRVRALFVDLDGAPLGPVTGSERSPHVVIESSPKRWHAYWLVSDCSLIEFSQLQQAIARKFDGDPKVCDLARVMRLPGFYHQKQRQPFLTRLVP